MQASPQRQEPSSPTRSKGGLTAVSDKESQQIIREKISLVELVSKYSELRSSGPGKYIGNCPLPGHDDSTPSFNVDESKQVFHCFGCKGGGNATSFVQAMENIPRAQATEKLLNSLGYTRQPRRPEDKPLDLMEKLAWTYHRNLFAASGKQALQYAKTGRSLNEETLNTFQVGFAIGNELPRIPVESRQGARKLRTGSEAELGERAGLYSQRGSSLFFDRLMFPLRNLTGDVVGFAGRAMPQPDNKESSGPKYLNGKESRWFKKDELLFGLYESASTIRTLQSALVVEGQLDVISLHQAGITNTVAAMGSALSAHNLRVLWDMAPEIVLVMDGDSAGLKAAKAAVKIALPLIRDGQQLRIVMLPDQLDPDEFIRKYGADQMRALVASSPQMSEFLLGETRKRHPILTAEGQAAFLEGIDALSRKMHNAPLLAQALRIQARSRATMYALTSGLRAGLADCAITPEVAITHPSARTPQEVMRDVLIPLLTSAGVLPQSGDPIEMNRSCLRSLGHLALKIDSAMESAKGKAVKARSDTPPSSSKAPAPRTPLPQQSAPVAKTVAKGNQPTAYVAPPARQPAPPAQPAARPAARVSGYGSPRQGEPRPEVPARSPRILDPRLRGRAQATNSSPAAAPKPTQTQESPSGRGFQRNPNRPG